MKYRYWTCDVFSETRFGGNPLAVLPHADGLSDRQMQQIAREFNFSETAFVFPPGDGHTRHVRIFTPASEVPFAGHPNVGTAFVLASHGELGEVRSSATVTFEEKAGLVPITIHESGGRITACELSAPEPLSLGEMVPARLVADAIGLSEADIVRETHPPQVASTGLPFLIAELKDRSALERARANPAGFEAIRSEGVEPSVYLYVHTRAHDDFDLRARMFAPLDGVPEDPATGSASCAVAGLLAHCDAAADGEFQWRIAQGVEIGRPSMLSARASKANGIVQSTGVGGACVLVSEGFLFLD